MWCKQCSREYQAQRYRTDRPKMKRQIEIARRRRVAEKQIYRLRYLESHPCVDCGESDPVVLEFDHVRGRKRAEISALVSSSKSLSSLRAQLDAEIAKCEVRCANCHRRKTAKDFCAWHKELLEG